MHVLTEADRVFWEEHGYVIVHEAVAPENVRAVVDILWEFQGLERDDPVRGTRS